MSRRTALRHVGGGIAVAMLPVGHGLRANAAGVGGSSPDTNHDQEIADPFRRREEWVHGAIVEVETPRSLVSLSRTGPGTRCEGRTGTSTWFHFPIPAPTVLDGQTPTLRTVVLLYRTERARIDKVHVYDGRRRRDASDVEGGVPDLNWTGDHRGAIDDRNVWPLTTPVPIRFGLGLSVHVVFEGDPDRPTSFVTFTAAGAVFDALPEQPDTQPEPDPDAAVHRCVQTIAELRTLRGETGDCLSVVGYYAAGDLGGGLFNWDSTSTEDDDRGLTIQPDGDPAIPGRWKRVIDGPLSIRWFGAKGNAGKPDESDDTVAIQDTIDAVATTGGTVVVPPGTYLVAGQIALKSRVNLLGTRPASQFKCTARDKQIFCGRGAEDLTIRGLVFFSTACPFPDVDSPVTLADYDNAAMSAIVFHVDDSGELDAEGYHTSRGITIEDCEISGFKVRGVRFSANRLPGGVRFANVRVANCYIHDITSMCGGTPLPAEGSDLCGSCAAGDEDCLDMIHFPTRGIQLMGCDGAVVTGNVVERIGTQGSHQQNQWAIYTYQCRDLMIANNRLKDCGSGVSVSGDVDPEGITILGNVIDLTATPITTAVCPAISEPDPVAGGRIGLALQSSASCTIVGNHLRWCQIQGNPTDTLIADNVIDLATATNVSGILLGPNDLLAHDLIIANNRITAASPPGLNTDGIAIQNGHDISITGNEIDNFERGINLRPATATTNHVERIAVTGNRLRGIRDWFFVVERTADVEIAGNRCEEQVLENPIMIPIDDSERVWVHHNRIVGKGQGVIRVGGSSSDVLVEDNVVRNAPVFRSFTAGNGNVARRNSQIGTSPSDGQPAGAGNLVLRFAAADSAPSVLGGELFMTSAAGSTIDRLRDGYVGQVVRIIADGAPTILRDAIGNIRLSGGGDVTLDGADSLTLVLLDADLWQEVGRTG